MHHSSQKELKSCNQDDGCIHELRDQRYGQLGRPAPKQAEEEGSQMNIDAATIPSTKHAMNKSIVIAKVAAEATAQPGWQQAWCHGQLACCVDDGDDEHADQDGWQVLENGAPVDLVGIQAVQCADASEVYRFVEPAKAPRALDARSIEKANKMEEDYGTAHEGEEVVRRIDDLLRDEE
eukprot:CAMPEP_0178394362 /NCGR_PEP_ID=MMETSP0689_2-20121128/12667_1 /TAXON_ID=160604 /ORGANISM="Amphidinium massartii, Strain CS-259" /LENGTH=178 /DNA_ID=CAMNT_0020014989 /DNA_START=422 /DNA_END=958 /DNA_ORIENTATION=+